MRVYLILLALVSGCLRANGFKISEQSLNGTALGSAYIAGARGADASYYNPANMGFSNDWGENQSEFEVTSTVINIPAFKFMVPSTNQGLYSVTSLKIDKSKENMLAIVNALGLGSLASEIGKTLITGGLKTVMNLVQNLQNLTNQKVTTVASVPDAQVVSGWTGTTNFILPKFFYKTRTHNGFTFGGSFTAPSGLGMKWHGLGGEFLQNVFYHDGGISSQCELYAG
ncbi:outer membrane protein P1 (ompP1) [Helicobacter bizzozeronii CCUG 35545]|nr:outer membrane protein P1 (ompP1) [Helicobacter bizzozeronii CCUG 35545]